MTVVVEADTAIVGSGIAGLLVARELLAADERVVVVERGGRRTWKQQVESDSWEADVATAEHTHEIDPRGEQIEWRYVYGLGGSTNRWAATAPRLLPEDFELDSRYGVSRDWPISYDQLAPWYRRAEAALQVAGEDNPLTPGTDYPLPAHPLSPQDRAVAAHLRPFVALPQARPSRAVRGRPACCGSARCQLCPVDAKFTALNGLGAVLEHSGLRVLTETIATRLQRARDRRISALQCVNGSGERVTIRARRFVVAANGLESPALLLRSGLEDDDTGHWLFDHVDGQVVVRTRDPVGPGRGASLVTGASYAYYAGEQRARRAAALVLPYNPGHVYQMYPAVVDGVVSGHDGRHVRRRAAHEWERTLSLDLYLDDAPQAANRVSLSPRRDRFGIPRTRVTYQPPSPYKQRALRHLLDDLPRRLRPLGAREPRYERLLDGAHLLGTVRMGERGEGVVDADLRHRRVENLFVCGGCVFPAPVPAHPTLTIAALAIRLGATLTRE